jgi:hypothetical protein
MYLKLKNWKLWFTVQYLPIEGLAAFNKATAELLLGADNPVIKQGLVCTMLPIAQYCTCRILYNSDSEVLPLLILLNFFCRLLHFRLSQALDHYALLQHLYKDTSLKPKYLYHHPHGVSMFCNYFSQLMCPTHESWVLNFRCIFLKYLIIWLLISFILHVNREP